jgi:hypothetical protein
MNLEIDWKARHTDLRKEINAVADSAETDGNYDDAESVGVELHAILDRISTMLLLEERNSIKDEKKAKI